MEHGYLGIKKSKISVKLQFLVPFFWHFHQKNNEKSKTGHGSKLNHKHSKGHIQSLFSTQLSMFDTQAKINVGSNCLRPDIIDS